MNLPLSARSFCVAALFLAAATPVHAQTSIGMSYGGYLPIGGSLIREVGGVNGAIVSYPILEKWQTGALVLSGRVTQRLTSRINGELRLVHVPGRVSTRDSTNQVIERSAFMSAVSVRAPFQLSRPGSGIMMQIAPGIAFQKRGGRAWNGVAGTTNPAGLMSVGVGGLLGRRSKWSMRIEAEDYFSSVQYNYAHWAPTTKRFHHDLMLLVGVDYSFKRPSRINTQR